MVRGFHTCQGFLIRTEIRILISMRAVALLLLAVVSLVPLLVEPLPTTWVEPYTSPVLAWGSKALVILVLIVVVVVRARLDRSTEPRPVLLTLALVGLAGFLTSWHWFAVDCNAGNREWQSKLYLDILNHQPGDDGQLQAPHQFRALPYGFTRSLEWLTGDWDFAGLAYRWFFLFWFVWGSYRFARLFHQPREASATLLVLPVLYPLSVQYYWGQLTDPLSHALFVLALLYMVQDRWAALAGVLALGVLAKETAVIVIPAYWACHWRQGWLAFLRACGLGVAGTAAFLAARVPLGWRPGLGSLNGTEALMMGTNLGIGQPLYTSAAPLFHDFPIQNYLHPLWFVGTFLPFIAWNWRRIDPRLKALFMTLTPLLLASSLCFSWLYESRNYLPLLPVLATMALKVKGKR